MASILAGLACIFDTDLDVLFFSKYNVPLTEKRDDGLLILSEKSV
jgi:hypothetical protein